MRKLLFIFFILCGCSKAPTYTPIVLADAGTYNPTTDILVLSEDTVEDTVSTPEDATGTVDALGPPPDVNVQFIDGGGIDTILPDPPKKDTSSGPPIGGPDTKGGLPDTGMWQTCVDKDGDGYGLGCYKGGDCDDNNPQLRVHLPRLLKAELGRVSL